jgi:hypothetical protein
LKASQPLTLGLDTPDTGSLPRTPGQLSTPGSPLLPVAPPSRAGILGFAARRQDTAGRSGTNQPPPIKATNPGPGLAADIGPPRSGAYTPTSVLGGPLTPRGSAPTSAPAGGVKRVYEGPGAGMSKKAKVAGTRSASPMPGSSLGRSADPKGGTQPKVQMRPGLGKGGRARTEGV